MAKDFEQFKAKHDFWIQCFSGQDRNSILNKIYQMVWNAAVFKIINESRRIAPVNSKGQTEVNGMLHRFIDRCFFDSQFLAVRRLTDSAYELSDPKKGTSSLVALLTDMKSNSGLITRENLFKADGMEYDYGAVQQRELAYALEQSKKGSNAYWIPSELDSHSVKIRHEHIDVLCGVKPELRKPSDVIASGIFEQLIARVKKASEEVNLHVNKYIAHAATPESRDYVKADEISVTLGHLWDAHKIICQTANFLDIHLLSRASHSFLPVPQYDHLEFIDRALVSSENVGVLSDAWHEFHRETDSWGQWGIKDLQKEMQA